MTNTETTTGASPRFDLSPLRNRRWLATLALILVATAAGSYFAGRALSQSRVRELPSPAALKTPPAPSIAFTAIPFSVAPLRLPVVQASPPAASTNNYVTPAPSPTPKPTPAPSPTPSCNPC